MIKKTEQWEYREKNGQKCFIAHKMISQSISSLTSLNNSVTQALQARKWTIRKVIGLTQSHLPNTECWNSNFFLLILKIGYMPIKLHWCFFLSYLSLLRLHKGKVHNFMILLSSIFSFPFKSFLHYLFIYWEALKVFQTTTI